MPTLPPHYYRAPTVGADADCDVTAGAEHRRYHSMVDLLIDILVLVIVVRVVDSRLLDLTGPAIHNDGLREHFYNNVLSASLPPMA